MTKNLLIVFAKNIILGKVKTRLAKSIGDNGAFEIYKHLVEITEKESLKLEGCDLHIYFSDVILNALWPNETKFIQQGNDLGERMMHAFKSSFEQGYKHVIGIGTDLPDLNAEIISQGFEKLKTDDAVFGPSEDGGYYLIGMNELHRCVFENKPWSTENLLEITINELKINGQNVAQLATLNDIATIEDLIDSSISKEFNHYLQ